MKRGRNSRNFPNGHKLPRSGILRGRDNYRRLFEESSVIRSNAIHFRYRLYDDSSEGFYIGFIAGKRLGKAVTRNRVKRLLREVYRTNRHLISDIIESPPFGLHGVFMAQRADLTYDRVKAEMLPLLEKMRVMLLRGTKTGQPPSPPALLQGSPLQTARNPDTPSAETPTGKATTGN